MTPAQFAAAHGLDAGALNSLLEYLRGNLERSAELRQLVLELRQQLQNAPIASTGGPAFPAFEVRTHDTGDLVENASQGMTLRDYFAAKASEDDIAAHSLKGFTEKYAFDLGNGKKELRIREARWTREQSKYRYADAMLKARSA